MKKQWPVWAGLILIGAVVGCNSTRPESPSRVYSVSVSIPSTNELRSSLLTSSNNELLYRVDGPGMNPLKGTIGPFASTAATGSIDFTIAIPSGPNRVLSLQLNDATTHQPLAIGAAALDLSGTGTPVSILAVDLGSVVRNCYNVNTTSYFGCTYGVNANTLFNSSPTYGTAYDFAVQAPGATCQIVDAEGNTGPFNSNTIAYLGNGNYVDFDRVPPDSDFYSQSGASKLAAGAAVSTVEAGDIYCVKLWTVPNGRAWVQVKAVGTPGISGPTFNFRVNASQPYYAYFQTVPDASGTPCPAQ